MAAAQVSAGNESPELEPVLQPRQRGQPWPGCRGWHRVERGVGCQRKACQENVISLHKRCSSPAPLPQQRQLKSVLPRLSKYCHIAASVEVLGPWKELRACFKRWKGAKGARLGGCSTPGLGILPRAPGCPAVGPWQLAGHGGLSAARTAPLPHAERLKEPVAPGLGTGTGHNPPGSSGRWEGTEHSRDQLHW